MMMRNMPILHNNKGKSLHVGQDGSIIVGIILQPILKFNDHINHYIVNTNTLHVFTNKCDKFSNSVY